jgi:hypothetical protein
LIFIIAGLAFTKNAVKEASIFYPLYIFFSSIPPEAPTICDQEYGMARVSGLEKKDAPWHLRWFYGVMRKMFGKDFTPAKIQMRLPGLVWGGIAMEAGLARKRLVSLRYIQLGKIRTAARVGCPF